MLEEIFGIIVASAGVYVLVGVLVAALFFSRWLGILDPAAKEGSVGFRVCVAPGIIALWPWLVLRIYRSKKSSNGDGAEALRRNHRLAFICLAIIGTVLFAIALAGRAPGFADLPKTEISIP